MFALSGLSLVAKATLELVDHCQLVMKSVCISQFLRTTLLHQNVATVENSVFFQWEIVIIENDCLIFKQVAIRLLRVFIDERELSFNDRLTDLFLSDLPRRMCSGLRFLLGCSLNQTFRILKGCCIRMESL